VSSAPVHERICVSGISSWNQSIDADLAMYRDLGVHTIGAALRKIDGDAGIERLASSGLCIHDVIGVGASGLARGIDVAVRLGAPYVVCTTGPLGDREWDQAAAAFVRGVAAANQPGVVPCVEHTNSLRTDVSFVHTLRDAVDVAREAGIGVCMEITACWAERDLARTIERSIDVIRLVQVSDVRAGTLSTPNRVVPGDGDIPLDRIIGRLLDAGYGGLFELELVGPRIEEEGYRSALARSCDALARLLERG